MDEQPPPHSPETRASASEACRPHLIAIVDELLTTSLDEAELGEGGLVRVCSVRVKEHVVSHVGCASARVRETEMREGAARLWLRLPEFGSLTIYLRGGWQNLWSSPLSTICAARIHLYQNLSAANKNPSAESAHAAILHNPPAQHLESTHTSHPNLPNQV